MSVTHTHTHKHRLALAHCGLISLLSEGIKAHLCAWCAATSIMCTCIRVGGCIFMRLCVCVCIHLQAFLWEGKLLSSLAVCFFFFCKRLCVCVCVRVSYTCSHIVSDSCKKQRCHSIDRAFENEIFDYTHTQKRKKRARHVID